MTTTQTRERDYKHEYTIRKKRNKRLAADLDSDKVEAFKALLDARGETFVNWLTKKMDDEMGAAK
jgi:hypothetical protein